MGLEEGEGKGAAFIYLDMDVLATTTLPCPAPVQITMLLSALIPTADMITNNILCNNASFGEIGNNDWYNITFGVNLLGIVSDLPFLISMPAGSLMPGLDLYTRGKSP